MEAPQKKECEAQTVVSIRHEGSHDEIGQVYHELYEWVRAHEVEVAGQGLTIFLSPPAEFDPASGTFEVCLPVEAAPEGDANVQVKELPACTVASVTVQGSYEQIPAHYTELLAWLSTWGCQAAGSPREVYLKRPDARGEGDPSEFVTEIQIPIE